MHVKVVAGGDFDVRNQGLKPVGPLPEHRPVVLLPLLADHPGGHVAHLMGQCGAQAGLRVNHLDSTQQSTALA